MKVAPKKPQSKNSLASDSKQSMAIAIWEYCVNKNIRSVKDLDPRIMYAIQYGRTAFMGEWPECLLSPPVQPMDIVEFKEVMNSILAHNNPIDMFVSPKKSSEPWPPKIFRRSRREIWDVLINTYQVAYKFGVHRTYPIFKATIDQENDVFVAAEDRLQVIDILSKLGIGDILPKVGQDQDRLFFISPTRLTAPSIGVPLQDLVKED